LRDLLSDSNPMVVANAVAALSEIDETAKEEVFKLNAENLKMLLAALNECTEWGQVFILHALSKYTPDDSREAEAIAERVTPRLAHANSAVVLSTIRVLMKLLEYIHNSEFVKTMCKKMTPPLVTLLQKEPEIQYVALRNINLIIQKRPQVLQNEMKVFFCKYNDPIYVKMEKLEIMIMLVSERTIEQVLLELKEYATEVDVEFVRKAVRAIGRCAIKLDRAAEKCIKVLLELIQTKVNYVVQEAIIVIKDIFRKYPNRYESIISTLCENLDTLDDPEAKASMIWIIGEYAERIENAGDLLETFLENFHDENSSVQLQLLTACVKLFLKKPKTAKNTVQHALELATKESENPDLRDRGYIYWRLLSADPTAAKQVVLGEKPLISEDSSPLDAALLNELISNMATLASVYHKPPQAFVSKLKKKVKVFDPSKAEIKASRSAEGDEDLVPAGGEGSLIDLDPSSRGSGGLPMDPFGFLSPVAAAVPANVEKKVLLSSEKGKGLEVRGAFVRRGGSGPVLALTLANHSNAPMSGFMIQFNKNYYRLKPAKTLLEVAVLQPGLTVDVIVALTNDGEEGPVSPMIHVAIKNNVEVFYFLAECPLHVFLSSDGALEKTAYLATWKEIPNENERVAQLSPLVSSDTSAIADILQRHNIFLIAKRHVNGNDVMYLSARVVLPSKALTTGGEVVLVEITLAGDASKCCLRTVDLELVPLFQAAIASLIVRPVVTPPF